MLFNEQYLAFFILHEIIAVSSMVELIKNIT